MSTRRFQQLDREITQALRRPRASPLSPARRYYDYEEGHFHHVVDVTPRTVTYDVVDDGIVIVRRTKPRQEAERAIRAGTWIPIAPDGLGPRRTRQMTAPTTDGTLPRRRPKPNVGHGRQRPR